MTTATASAQQGLNTFPSFVKDRERLRGFDPSPFHELGKTLRRHARDLLVPVASEVEPNWASLCLMFDAEPGHHELKSAMLNGPRNGDSDVTELLRERVPRSVWHLLRAHFAVDVKWKGAQEDWELKNPNYRFEFVPDRTEVLVHDGDTEGYILSVDNDLATVLCWPNWDGVIDQEDTFTAPCGQLEREFHDEDGNVYTMLRYLGPGESASKKHEEEKAAEM